MKIRTIALSLFLMIVFTGCKKSYQLKFNPKAGDKYRVTMTTNSTTEQESGGAKTEVKALTEMLMQYEITKTEGDNKVLKIIFQSMKSTQEVNGRKVVIDTKVPGGNDPSWQMMNSMMGSEFLVTVNSKGEVMDVKGMQDMVDRMTASARSRDSLTAERMSAGLKNFMSDDILKNMMEQSFKIFPESEVKEGSSWNKNMEIAKPMPMNIASTYTLNKLQGNMANVGVKSVITPGKGGMEMMGMKIETELNGTQVGHMDIDKETGMTLATEITQDIAGKLKVMDSEIPMKIKSVISLKATKM